MERTLHVMESLTTQPCPALISTGGDPIDSTAAVGQFRRSISSQQNGDNGCPPNITCAHVAAEGLFSWAKRGSRIGAVAQQRQAVTLALQGGATQTNL